MIPNYFFDIKSNYTKYFNDQYPVANDCKTLDQQILSIQKDIDNINKRILMNYEERSLTQISKDVQDCSKTISGSLTTNNIGTQLICKEQKKNIGTKVRLDSLNLLKGMLTSKKNTFALGDCRNKIELIRQEETASVFSETSAKQEENVLNQSKSKQYFLIGAGSLLLLTTLVVVLIKRNK